MLQAKKKLHSQESKVTDTVYSWHSTVHAQGQLSMDFELMQLLLSSLNQNSVQYLWIRRDLVTNVLCDGQCRAWRSQCLNIVGCCNFTEAKSHEACTVLLDKGLFLKNEMTFATKHSVWPLSTLKTVNLQYHSSLSVAWMVRFCSKFTKFDRICTTTRTW